MYQSLSRQAIQRVRLIYWEKLASIPLVKGILTLPFLPPLFLSYQHTMYQSLSRQAIQRVRLIYWEKLASIPLVKGIFTLTGGVPIKILGSTSLKEGKNKYCKEVRPLPPSLLPSLPPSNDCQLSPTHPPSLPPSTPRASRPSTVRSTRPSSKTSSRSLSPLRGAATLTHPPSARSNEACSKCTSSTTSL